MELRLVWVVLLGFSTVLIAADPSVRALNKAAEKAEKLGNKSEAILLYNQAAAKGSASAAARAQVLLRHIAKEGPGDMVPFAAAATATPEDLADIFAPISPRDLKEAKELLPPPDLALPANLFDLDLKAPHQKLWQEAAKMLGISVDFDSEYPASGQPARYQGIGQTARQMLQGLSAATGSFVVVLGPKRILVVKDTTQKRQEREPTVAVILSLPDPTSTQELQESARTVQQVMEIQKFAIDTTRRMVLLRDRLSKVRPAQKLFEQLLGTRPSVMVEIELFEVTSTTTRNLGAGLPTSSRLFWLSRLLNNDPDKVDAGAPLATFGGGFSVVGMTIADATVTAAAQKGWGQTLQRAFVQSASGQPAQLLLGERYPIVTGTFGGGDSATSGTGFPPTIQYENLGFNIKITPFVHDMEEMTLEVEAEFKLRSGAEINGLPVLTNRKFTSRVRVREGEWALLGGLNQESESVNATGIPGLMQLPGLGPLLRTNSLEGKQNDLLLLVKPRLLSVGTDLAPDSIFLGPEGRPSMPL